MPSFKLVYLVLDGAADSLNDNPTSLEAAYKPYLDEIVKRSKCGLMFTIGRGYPPESDAAVLSILGYNPEFYYTGRGPLEALGVGVTIKEGYEVVFRGNFATIDVNTWDIIDRRVGRSLKSSEARELAKSIDNMPLLDTGYARVYHTIGHRLVVVIGDKSHKLAADVDNTDPAYVRRGLLSVAVKTPSMKVRKCVPLKNTAEAKRACELVNEFTKKAIEILSTHPLNEYRRKHNMLEANAVLLRDAGDKMPRLPSISEKYGVPFTIIAEMPVEKGIGRAAGMNVFELSFTENTSVEEKYEEMARATINVLERGEAVYVHIKGPDEPGHDKDFKKKVKSIETIDRVFVKKVLEYCGTKCFWIITSDHATPYSIGAHTDDPVPVAISGPGISSDGINRFTEKNCKRGSLGVIEHGWLLLDKFFRMVM